MTQKPSVLFIDSSNFFDESIGGSSSFAKQFISVFANRIAIVGFSNSKLDIGRWSIRDIKNNGRFYFFNLGLSPQKQKRVLFPNRLKVFSLVKYYLPAIKSLGISNVFIQSPEILFVVSSMHWDSICYRFAGIQNPVKNSRYKHLRKLGFIFDFLIKRSLSKESIHSILVSADKKIIEDFIKLNKFPKVVSEKFVSFPTRVDTDIFNSTEDKSFKMQLNIKNTEHVFITVGRISTIKGWDLIIEAFEILLLKGINCKLIFVGDGEDKVVLQKKVEEKKIDNRIIITGFQKKENIVKYLNISDVFLTGSYYEGWSLAMLEALAMGLKIVSTNVSGASDLIIENVNGYILYDRNPNKYADAMISSLQLPNPNITSITLARKYSHLTMDSELSALWPPLQT